MSEKKDTLNNASDVLRLEIFSPDGEIVLSQFVLRDSEEIFALINGNRSHLSQFGDVTSEKYPTLEAVRESIEHPKNPKRLRFAIRDKQGHMRRAVQMLTEYGLGNLGYETIYGDVTEGNTASANVLLKAGYQETERHDGKIRYAKEKGV